MNFALLALVFAFQLEPRVSAPKTPALAPGPLLSAQSSLDSSQQTLHHLSLHDGVHAIMSGDTHLGFHSEIGLGHATSVPGNPAFNQVELHRIDKRQAEVKEKKDGAVVATVSEKLSSRRKRANDHDCEQRPCRSRSQCGREAEARRSPRDPLSGEWTAGLSKTRLRQGLVLKIEADGKDGVRFSGEFSYAARFDGKQYDLKNSRNDTVTLELVDRSHGGCNLPAG